MSNIYDVCIIGLGPAGIGVLSSLGKVTLQNSICFEKGLNISNCKMHESSACVRCTPCNVVYGIGGASRFSCGKISGFPAGSGLEYFFGSKENLKSFMNTQVEALKETLQLQKIDVSEKKITSMSSYFKHFEIDYKYYDVYEFKKSVYFQYINSQIKRAQDAGLKIYFEANVIKIEKCTDDVYYIFVNIGNATKKYKVRKIIIATGNLNFNLLPCSEYAFDAPPTYEIGVRVIVPTDKIIKFLDCHGDLKLKYKAGRTYCASKNGHVISYSSDNMSFLEGYTDEDDLTDNTNLAIIFKSNDLSTYEEFINKYKSVFHGVPVKQKFNDYLSNKISSFYCDEKYIFTQTGNIRDMFNENTNSDIIEFIDNVLIKALGLSNEDIVLVSPELKLLNNITLNNDFQAAPNIYIVGSATGKFRGILQSLCSGIYCGNIIGR